MQHLTRPLVLACLAFLAGAAAGLRFGGAAVVGCAVLGAAAIFLLWGLDEDDWRSLIPWLAIGLIGAANGAWARGDSRTDCRARLSDEAALHVSGVLVASYNPPDSSERAPTALLRAEPFRAGRHRCMGELRVKLPRDFPAAAAGSRLALSGSWWRYPAPVVPSRWPRPGGSPGMLMARHARVEAAPSAVRSPLLWARGRTQAAVLRLFPRHAPLADALLLNRRERLDPALSRHFAESGLVHLLAISGSHVAMIGAVLLLLARSAGATRRAAAWSTVLLVAAYLALIGAPASALRSGVMLALVLLGGVLQRPSSPITAMAGAALVLAALDPRVLLDAGFQLSFAGVIGLCVVRPALLEHLPHQWNAAGWRRTLADALVSSVAAFATTAPVVAYHFAQSAPVSILANLPAIPLASLALVGIAAAVAVEPLAAPLARLLADGAGLCLDLLGGVAALAARVPGGHFAVSRPSIPLWLAAAAALAVAWRLAARMRREVRWTLATGSTLCVILIAPLGAGGGEGLEIAFLDVGQGDAVALRTPAGRWLLVDAGPLEESYDAGERRVLPYLRARGGRRVETMVLTHPHADHIGGAAAVLREMPVGRVVEPELPFASPVYQGLLERARAAGVEWAAARQDRVLRIDGVELMFLWPTPSSLDSPEDANDISAVVQIRYGAFSALLTGDAPAWVEERLVERYGAALHSQVLKAGHHGSRTATSALLLRTVRPQLAVVSCGRRNRFGHPAPETMARLAAAGVPVARTDADGTVLLRVAEGGEAWEWDAP